MLLVEIISYGCLSVPRHPPNTFLKTEVNFDKLKWSQQTHTLFGFLIFSVIDLTAISSQILTTKSLKFILKYEQGFGSLSNIHTNVCDQAQLFKHIYAS